MNSKRIVTARPLSLNKFRIVRLRTKIILKTKNRSKNARLFVAENNHKRVFLDQNPSETNDTFIDSPIASQIQNTLSQTSAPINQNSSDMSTIEQTTFQFDYEQQRTPLLKWLRETAAQFQLLRSTFGLAACYFDRYFQLRATDKYADINQVYHILAACITLAVKHQQTNPLKTQKLAQLLSINCKDINHSEFQVVKTFKYKLTLTPLAVYVDQIMHRWDQFQNNCNLFLRHNDQESYQRFRKIYHQIDLRLEDHKITCPQSQIQQVFLNVLGDSTSIRHFFNYQGIHESNLDQAKFYVKPKNKYSDATWSDCLSMQTYQ